MHVEVSSAEDSNAVLPNVGKGNKSASLACLATSHTVGRIKLIVKQTQHRLRCPSPSFTYVSARAFGRSMFRHSPFLSTAPVDVGYR